MRLMVSIAVAVLVGLSAYAGPSEEERCKISGGVWRETERFCEASSR